mgnify:CR=1 FL=1
MNEKGWKIAGLVLTVLGAGVSVGSALIGGKQQEILIEKKANEAVAKLIEKK